MSIYTYKLKTPRGVCLGDQVSELGHLPTETCALPTISSCDKSGARAHSGTHSSRPHAS